MNKIYVITGKSSCGKDTVFRELLKDESLKLRKLVGYTTRPMRDGETEGEEYHFVSTRELENFRLRDKLIECRNYDTVHGIWSYATVDDGQVKLQKKSYLYIGTLESFEAIRKYYGKEVVVPFYLQVDDGLRLQRALNRERNQENPKYQEMCRRFLADEEDFSEEKLEELGITNRFDNTNLTECIEQIKEVIKQEK